MPEGLAVVGRESKAVPLSDNTVSRRHCEFRPGERGEWFVRDLGSSNGTYINGQRADRVASLKLGDQVRIGRTLMVFGNQPGVVRARGGYVELAGVEAGMDSSIIDTMSSNDDSLVLAVPEPALAAVGNLKLLYRLSATLGSSFNEQHVLEVVMDLVFEQVQADRGIILLMNTSGELTPRVVRVRDDQPARSVSTTSGTVLMSKPRPESPEKIHASRTIINHVITTGSGVLSSNAMSDPRFAKGKSVHDLGIRSALCVPIKARRMDASTRVRVEPPVEGDGEILGVLYVDSSVRNYTYSTDQLRLLSAIGLQAGLAMQNARLYQNGLAAERLAAVGETTAALSHSIKNILQALRGGADVVDMGLRANNLDQSKKGWGVVQRNLDKIYNLTLNLLAYSRQRDAGSELINPRIIINECVELVAGVATERGIMATAEVADDVPAVPLDPDGIHQVLMNLLSNAIDAIPPGKPGVVNVRATYNAAGHFTQIDVSDNGTGIDPALMSSLFQLFHSTKGNRGTGLGLAVAKKIIEEHNGTIVCSSKHEIGTTFTIRLPTPDTQADPGKTVGGSTTR